MAADEERPGDEDEQRARREREQRGEAPDGGRAEPRRSSLSQEIAERYDPARLRKIVVDGAGKGERLELQTQSEMERRLGGRFDDVRVFRGPLAEAVTAAHRADAITVGGTGMILVREGPRSDPKTALGKALLAHELTHVAQGQRGLQLAKEGGASSSEPHEQEAEAIEAEVHAAETGRAAPPRDAPRRDPAERRRRVVARVLELLDEEQRILAERLGD